MITMIKIILGEIAGMEHKLISNDMHLVDDLHLDKWQMKLVYEDIEEHMGVELNENKQLPTYVADLIAMVRAAY